MKNPFLRLRHAAAICALLAASAAQAGPISLGTASLFGDVLVSGSAATMTNSNVALSGDGGAVAGGNALDLFVYSGGLEDALGLAAGTLGADAFEGSALRIGFMGAAGAILRFDWTLSTESFDPLFLDRAFVMVDDILLSQFNVTSALQSSSFSFVLGTGGLHSLTVGVLDVNDYTVVSTFSIDNISVVPEPGSLGLLLTALLAARCSARRRA